MVAVFGQYSRRLKQSPFFIYHDFSGEARSAGSHVIHKISVSEKTESKISPVI